MGMGRGQGLQVDCAAGTTLEGEAEDDCGEEDGCGGREEGGELHVVDEGGCWEAVSGLVVNLNVPL